MNKTLFKLSFPECTEMGWHVFSFDSAESVDAQWVILYIYDPCSLYMNNVGWGDWWSDKQLSRKNVFILTPKHIATSVLWFMCLSFYVGIKYAFYALTLARLRGRYWKMYIANTDVTFCYGRRIKTIKLDEKAMLRNWYNQIPHPALDTKWERKTYNLDGMK